MCARPAAAAGDCGGTDCRCRLQTGGYGRPGGAAANRARGHGRRFRLDAKDAISDVGLGLAAYVAVIPVVYLLQFLVQQVLPE